jgi:hypothetical protein
MTRGEKMKLKKWLVMSAVVLGIAGCATSSPPRKYYSSQEYRQMTVCVGMADTVYYVATQKLAKAPKQDMANFYTSKPHAQLNLAIVERVYKDDLKDAWLYTAETFFPDCALNMAGVSAARVRLAGHCIHQTIIAGQAYSLKSANATKEEGYAFFAKLRGDTPRKIVDRVYASTEDSGTIKLGVWKSCMADLAEM